MNDWISVQDQLPPYNEIVLVRFINVLKQANYTTCVYVNQRIGAYTEVTRDIWYVNVSGGHELRTVTHWSKVTPPEGLSE